jgi:hypothetical protein
MAFPLLMVLGAAAGAAKAESDRRKAEAQRQTEGTIAAYSPWTGMQAQRVADPDAIGSTLQGASMGASMGQNMDAAKGAEALQASEIGKNNSQANYYQAQAGGGSAGAIGANAPQDPSSQNLMQYGAAPNMSQGMPSYSPYAGMPRRQY